MAIFLIVILVMAALLEYLSMRGGEACVEADFELSGRKTETNTDVELITRVRRLYWLPVSYCEIGIDLPPSARLPEGADIRRDGNRSTLRDVYRLWSRRPRERRMTIQMEKRGAFLFSGRTVRRGDFLGISLTDERFDVHRTILVYPPRMQSAELSEALGSYSGLLAAQRWLLRDPVLIMGVREYTGHEPMHAISWTQTARRNELTVREFDYTRSLNCRVILAVNGLEPDEGELLDRCCSAARTVCEKLMEEGVEPVLSTNAALIGHPNRPIRSVSAGPNREEDLLEVLARVTAFACCSVSSLAEECLAEMTEISACVLITPHNDEEAQKALQLLSARSMIGAKLFAMDELEEDRDGGVL